MEVPLTGGARSVKRLYHQQHAQDISAPFGLTGIHAMLFDDDTLAAFINSPAALLPWNGDQSLLIDRYDVRHLLQDLSGVRKRRPAPPLVDCTEEELNHERFRDLQDALPVEGQQAEDFSKSLAGGYQAVPFSYSEEAVENGKQTGSRHGSVGFYPAFPVPDYLLTKLPPSEKLHQIMAGTAKFVKEHGGQSEVLLKVKQGSNPMFGFLNVDHHLHEYYRFLVEHPELLQPVPHNNSRPNGAANNTGEALSLLGFAYGSGDEDDDKALRSEGSQGDKGRDISCGGDEPIVSNDDSLIVANAGGIAAKGRKASATMSPLPKCGEEAQPKVHEHTSKPLSLLDKKKKSLIGSKELIQPNKKIVSQLMPPRVKEVADASSRLPQKSEQKTSSWHSVPTSKDLDYGMSADAAAAVVLAATRGARGLRQDSSNNNKSPSSSGLSLKDLEANRRPSTAGTSKGMSLFGLGQTDMRLAKAVAEAAAIAASHEADSADTLLTPAEKLKAERLRKAKMFAAMIKSGKCTSGTSVKPAEPPPQETLPAATSAKSNDVGTESFSGQVGDGKAVSNGKAMSTGENPRVVEEVEDSDVNKNTGLGIIDPRSKQSLKDRVYRKRETTEKQTLDQRSDSEESDRGRKRKSHQEHGDKKHRHSRRKKHRVAFDSESADSGRSSGNEIEDNHHNSRSQRRHRHRKKRSHRDRDESRDAKQSQSRHKNCDDDLHTDSPDQTHKHRKSRQSGTTLNISEDENGKVDHEEQPSRAANGEGEAAASKQAAVVATEVSAEIRAKVRAMLLSTL